MIELSGLLWPVHLKPRPDELLSSWLLRLTRGYSMVPHSFCKRLWPSLSIWNRDIDRLAPAELITDLAQHTGISLQRAWGTTLKAYEGVIYETLVTKSVSQWILPLQVWHRIRRRPGQQYCPACLDTDDPYFRRRWRLSFVTGCVEHGLVLLDRCVGCGAPVNFHRAAYWVPRLSTCYRCGKDLTDGLSLAVPLGREELRAQKHLQYTTMRGYLELDGYGPVYSHLYFHGYRVMSRVLLSPRGRVALRTLTQDLGLPSADTDNTGDDNIDFAPIELRRHVVLACWQVLHAWPDGFAEFCREYHIRGSDLRRDGPVLPFWMHDVIRRELDKPNYCAAAAEVLSAVRHLELRGLAVNPKSVYRLLGRATPKDQRVYREVLEALSQASLPFG